MKPLIETSCAVVVCIGLLASGVSGCKRSGEEPQLKSAQEVLDAMVAAYQKAESYSDAGPGGYRQEGSGAVLNWLDGSPNFTSAALLTTPPDGNAELAVLTRLPPRGGGAARVEDSLGLDDLFGPILDWKTIRSKAGKSPPPRGKNAFALTDATFHLAGQTMVVSVHQRPCWCGPFSSHGRSRRSVDAAGRGRLGRQGRDERSHNRAHDQRPGDDSSRLAHRTCAGNPS